MLARIRLPMPFDSRWHNATQLKNHFFAPVRFIRAPLRRSLSWFGTSRFLFGIALLVVTSGQVSLAQISPASSQGVPSLLPTLGDNLELTAGAERRMGDRIAASIYRDPDYIDDPVLSDYLQAIWQPLMAAARARGELSAELDERFSWDVFLIRDRSINAFALPGGYFGVHLGLIGAVNTRDELAAVLGHELSHVTQRHISRLITQQARVTPLVIGAMILGALAASKSPSAANAAIVGGQAVAAQSQLNFSRDMEREADRVGFGVMTDAGFDSRGIGSMFEKLQQAARLNDSGAFPYLRSHPLNTERMAEVQARLQLAARSSPGVTAQGISADANARELQAMMAARARVLADPGVDALRAMLDQAQRQARLTSPQKSSPTGSDARGAGVLYAGALAAAKMRDFTVASSLAEKLKSLHLGHAAGAQVVDWLMLEIELLANKVPPGASLIKLSQTMQRAELLLQAQAMLAAGQTADVSARLQTWVTEHPKDATVWQLLASAYGKQGQVVRAIRSEAEGRAAQLDYSAALDRLRAAQTLMRSSPGNADFIEGSIIDTRSRQLEVLLREQALQDKLDR